MITKGHIKDTVAVLICVFALSGCGVSREPDVIIWDMNGEMQSSGEVRKAASEELVSEISGEESMVQDVSVPEVSQGIPTEENSVFETQTREEALLHSTEMLGSEELLDAFLAGEVPATYDVGEESEGTLMISDFSFGEEEWEYYSIGERIDLDNDGENEQIVNGPYGGIYFDARGGKVYVLAEGEGTSGVLSYTEYDNATWIVHRDTSHAGRQMYWLTKYDGEGNIADEFQLSAEYWELPSGEQYNENSDFTYRDEKISMKEYEALRDEILGLEAKE